jgi:hypothetical protein
VPRIRPVGPGPEPTSPAGLSEHSLRLTAQLPGIQTNLLAAPRCTSTGTAPAPTVGGGLGRLDGTEGGGGVPGQRLRLSTPHPPPAPPFYPAPLQPAEAYIKYGLLPALSAEANSHPLPLTSPEECGHIGHPCEHSTLAA